jgi:hypothetical protein
VIFDIPEKEGKAGTPCSKIKTTGILSASEKLFYSPFRLKPEIDHFKFMKSLLMSIIVWQREVEGAKQLQRSSTFLRRIGNGCCYKAIAL